MNEWEKKRQHIQSLKAPEQLEQRLQQALKNKKKRKRWTAGIAVAAISLLFLAVFHYQAFAYYGKQFFGYDALMSESLSKLNKEQKGQAIEQAITLSDGTTVFVDGVISDRNRFHVYYRLENANQINKDIRLEKITGFLTNEYMEFGTFQMNENHTEGFGVQTFSAVSPFAKNLTLHIAGPDDKEEMTISYQASAAVPTILKKTIDQTVAYDFGELKFTEMIATQASTVLKGKLTKEDERNFPLHLEGIQLLVDDQVLEPIQMGHKSGIFGSSFELMYEAIPAGTEKLELHVDIFNGYTETDVEVELAGKWTVGDNWLEVVNIRQDEKTYVTIASEANVYFDDVVLLTEQGNIPLETTEIYDAMQRTLVFDTAASADKLRIGGVYYIKPYGKTLQINF